jgi:hypothetical protein
MTICAQCEDTGWLKVRDDNGLIHIEECDWCQGKSPLQTEVKRLRDVLRQVEWCGEVDEWPDYCPLCDQPKAKGHSPDCPIGAALEVKE